jgi:LmbE family N-acetylglucosaminyl deacetylase
MNRRLLAVLAHPDDESYGIGGTLARYAAEGVDVHVAIATDGAAGSIDAKWQGDRSRLAEARAIELREASKILGVKTHMLGFRDSGYIGDLANEHPDAFINVDQDEAIGRVVKLIRELCPQVVVTHDQTGGYYHPDHIHTCEVTTAAFHAAGKAGRYPEIGPEPYQPERLYYYAFSNRWVKYMIFLMRLRGMDPSRAGRNQDVDFTRIGVNPGEITTTIDYRKFWDVKMEASAAHGSQGGGTSVSRLLPSWIQRQIFGKETFMRVYPPVPEGFHESDLFNSK